MSFKPAVAVLSIVLGLAALSQPPAAADTPFASDGFARTVVKGLGQADVGGAWTVAGTTSNVSVGSGVASLRMVRGKTLSGYLTGSPTLDTDVTASVRLSALPVGGSAYAALVARRTGSHEYTANAIVATNGSVRLSLTRDGKTLRTSSAIGSTLVAGRILRLRMQAVGAGTTTLRSRAWLDGTTEPTTWQVSTTDATAPNQVAGGVGFRGYLSSGTTNDPLTYSFDDFTATSVGGAPPANQPPSATFTTSSTDLTATFDATTSSDPDGAIASYAWDFGDGTTGAGVTTSHGFASGGTYTVALTVTDDDGATARTTRAVTVAAGRPTQAQWLSDVTTALAGGEAYLDSQVGVVRPAIVLDIDNTSLQSYYQSKTATPPVLSFAQRAVADGYAVLFATGRGVDNGGTLQQLQNAGYQVDALCFRDTAVSLQASKTNCRAAWVAAGYTIVANVGNRTTDLDGGNSGQQYLLPNYGFLD